MTLSYSPQTQPKRSSVPVSESKWSLPFHYLSLKVTSCFVLFTLPFWWAIFLQGSSKRVKKSHTHTNTNIWSFSTTFLSQQRKIKITDFWKVLNTLNSSDCKPCCQICFFRCIREAQWLILVLKPVQSRNQCRMESRTLSTAPNLCNLVRWAI